MRAQSELALKPRDSPGAITVAELLHRVRGVMGANFAEVCVVGEISNARLAPSNHLYFTLKDDRASVSAVMFRSAFSRVRFKVTDGLEVVVRGRVDIFEARGQMQLYVEEIEPRGQGALQLAFEQLKRRLGDEGLFDAARKRPLPFMPRAVGIVTAPRGAAIRDMLRILFDRFPKLHVILRPSRVQGEGAANEIAIAIADLNRDARAEVIIVGRGGGSIEDLWAFNEEVVARAIVASRVPVVSAVGHEVDFTIADFVADLRAPTPTAAAASVVPSYAELGERISADAASLLACTARSVENARQELDDLSVRMRAPAAAIREARLQIAHLAHRMSHPIERTAIAHGNSIAAMAAAAASAAAQIAARWRAATARAAAQLDSLSPLRVLDRGYAVVTMSGTSKVVADSGAVAAGDDIDIRLARGAIRARVSNRLN
jgi:exodeoxyribonuclease VII large subunit